MPCLLFLLELLLPIDQVDHSFDHLIHEFYFVFAHSVDVRDVADAIVSSCAGKTARAARLQLAIVAPLFEAWLLRGKWDLNHHRSTEPSAAIGWAREDVAVLFGNLEATTHLLARALDSLHEVSKPIEDGADVVSLLHTNDAQVVLLVHPNERRLLVIVVDTSGMWPVALHPPREQHWLIGFLEEEVVLDQSFLSRLVNASWLRRVSC